MSSLHLTEHQGKDEVLYAEECENVSFEIMLIPNSTFFFPIRKGTCTKVHLLMMRYIVGV